MHNIHQRITKKIYVIRRITKNIYEIRNEKIWKLSTQFWILNKTLAKANTEIRLKTILFAYCVLARSPVCMVKYVSLKHLFVKNPSRYCQYTHWWANIAILVLLTIVLQCYKQEYWGYQLTGPHSMVLGKASYVLVKHNGFRFLTQFVLSSFGL